MNGSMWKHARLVGRGWSWLGNPTLRFLAVLLILLTALTVGLIRDLSSPRMIPLDPGVFRFTDFFFSQNIDWLPYPSLTLDSNWSLYPFGLKHSYLQWSFERQMIVSLLTSLLGPGEWSNFYFLGSIFLTAFGAFLVLRPIHGAWRASSVALIITFCNFYVMFKFLYHFPYSCVHWSVLGILLDYVISRRVWLGEPLGARLVLGRAAVLVATLGLDLGYMAGFGLSSFVLTCTWIAIVLLLRSRGRLQALGSSLRSLASSAWSDARVHRLAAGGLLALCAIAAWLYIPLVLQLRSSMDATQFAELRSNYRWEHPARILFPIVPGVERRFVDSWFSDRGEEVGMHFWPGLSLVLLGLMGAIAGFRRFGAIAPIVVLFLMLLLYNPVEFPTLRVFPWFAVARSPGRATAVFPVLLMIMALQFPIRHLSRRWLAVASGLVISLLCVETVGAYMRIRDMRDMIWARTYFPDKEFYAFMGKIRATPGEGILEWPFSVAPRGGALGAYQYRVGGSAQFAEFHGKKVVGGFFGRMEPAALQPLEKSGWAKLFLPTDSHRSKRMQRRDFTPDEWAFFEGFFCQYDLAGILLYRNALPEETVEGFHARFGRPLGTLDLGPVFGPVEFIARRSRPGREGNPKEEEIAARRRSDSEGALFSDDFEAGSTGAWGKQYDCP